MSATAGQTSQGGQRQGLANRQVKVESPLEEGVISLKAAELRDGLSIIPDLTIEFLTGETAFNMDDLVGHPMAVGICDNDENWHMKRGTCVSLRYLGFFASYAVYSATVRPWLWFLTRRKDNRIFQDQNAVEIIRSVIESAGFSGNVDLKLSASYDAREYCVQFDESDFDFISRLMEEEGIYYYFDFSGDVEKLVLIDDCGQHPDVPSSTEIPYVFEGGEIQQREDSISRWLWGKAVHSGKVTLDDYDFTKARTDLKVDKPIPQGAHSHTEYEVYEYPGRYAEVELGETRAKVKMEAIASRYETWRATSNTRRLSVGHAFTLTDHARDDQNDDYMITEAVFQYQIEGEDRVGQRGQAARGGGGRDGDPQGVRGRQRDRVPSKLKFVEEHDDTFRCEFRAMRKTAQFRAPLKTPWPRIAGLQTAEVVGPEDEEIHTDEFGRIKVQFHWDRQGQKNENSSCWVRTMNPWTGRQWGMVSIPRIGQEVVIQFEGGDPDRPIVVGALYNDVNMPPYTLPEDKMISGVKTDKYKDGGGFHELIMDDLAGEELVRFQSERDYEQIIKNNAEITIGLEHKSSGDLTQTIQNSKFETIKQGDFIQNVEVGKAEITATTSIELICGQSRIKIEPAQITMTTPTFKVDAQMTAEVKSGLSTTVKSNISTTVSGSATVTVRGGLVTIN